MLLVANNDRKTKTEPSSKTAEQLPEQERSSQFMSGMGQSIQQRGDLADLQKTYGNQAVLRMSRGGRSPVANPLQGGVLQGKCACGNTAGSSGSCTECQSNQEGILQTKLQISEPGDRYEQEADQVADQVMRMPEPTIQHQMEPEGKEKQIVQRKAIANQVTPLEQQQESSEVPTTVHEVLRSSGQPLDPTTRSFMEPRFGHDFSRVRVHSSTAAERSAREVSARAYTVGQNIVFGARQLEPGSTEGRRLLAHELTHVLQQVGFSDMDRGTSSSHRNEHLGYVRENTTLYRSVISAGESTEIPQTETPQVVEGESLGGDVMPAVSHRTATIPSPEICPPPKDMDCPVAVDSPSAVVNTLIFPVNLATLNDSQKSEVDATAAAWHATGGSVTARIDGYASAEGKCDYNWNLSCRRAEAVASELKSPSDGTPGVPMSYIEVFAKGESDVAGRALARNRQATISIPVVLPTPAPPPPVCKFPVSLGSARGCGSGSDFTHFDFPSISAASTAKLAAWAASHPFSRGPFRSTVTDTECEFEMDGVLTGLAGAEGHAAFSRFAAGTGGTVTHHSSSTLGAMALTSGSFLRTVARVQADIEAQLATQSASGVLDPCILSVAPPPTFFAFSDGRALKAVIGGTQGEKLFATRFFGNLALRTYSMELRFIICDDFGVDEADLYAPGLFGFWVLQHERSATKYAPFINELDLAVTVTGTF